MMPTGCLEHTIYYHIVLQALMRSMECPRNTQSGLLCRRGVGHEKASGVGPHLPANFPGSVIARTQHTTSNDFASDDLLPAIAIDRNLVIHQSVSPESVSASSDGSTCQGMEEASPTRTIHLVQRTEKATSSMTRNER